MKSKDFEKLKAEDKVIVKIQEASTNSYGERISVKDDVGGHTWIKNSRNVLGRLEDFTPAEEKIQMTVEEKKEFDNLRGFSLGAILINLDVNTYPNLYNRLFGGEVFDNNQAQLKFARVWDNPSLIEVIKPEHEFKVGDLVKINGEKAIIIQIKKDVTEPFKLVLQDGSYGRANKNKIEFVKSDAVNWEDEK